MWWHCVWNAEDLSDMLRLLSQPKPPMHCSHGSNKPHNSDRMCLCVYAQIRNDLNLCRFLVWDLKGPSTMLWFWNDQKSVSISGHEFERCCKQLLCSLCLCIEISSKKFWYCPRIWNLDIFENMLWFLEQIKVQVRLPAWVENPAGQDLMCLFFTFKIFQPIASCCVVL